MFTLRDPRMDALSQAGSNFGGGLADSLVQYIQNRNLQNFSSKVTPDMTLQQRIGLMAKAGLTPQQQELQLSAPVQTQMSREKTSAKFRDILSRPGAMDAKNVNATILELAAANAEAPMEGAADILNLVQRSAKGSGFGSVDFGGSSDQPPHSRSTPSGRSTSSNSTNLISGAPLPSRQGISQAQDQSIALQNQSQPMQGVQQATPNQAPDFRSNVVLDAPVNAPPTPAEYQDYMQKYFNATGDAEGAKAAAQDWVALDKGTRDAQLLDLERSETARTTRLDEEQRVRAATEGFIKKRFGDQGLHPDLENLAYTMMNSTPGTDEQRWRQVSRILTDTNDALSAISDGETRPNLGALRPQALERYLKKRQHVIQTVMDKAPALYKREIGDMFKSVLTANGDGLIEAEMQVNPLSSVSKRLADSVERAPVNISGRAGKGGAKREEMQARKEQEAVYEMADKIVKITERDQNASPLLLRHLMLKKGYTEEQVAEAFHLASEHLSPYQRSQVAELNRPERPGLNTIFAPSAGAPLEGIVGGDKSQRTVWDLLISGRR